MVPTGSGLVTIRSDLHDDSWADYTNKGLIDALKLKGGDAHKEFQQAYTALFADALAQYATRMPVLSSPAISAEGAVRSAQFPLNEPSPDQALFLFEVLDDLSARLRSILSGAAYGLLGDRSIVPGLPAKIDPLLVVTYENVFRHLSGGQAGSDLAARVASRLEEERLPTRGIAWTTDRSLTRLFGKLEHRDIEGLVAGTNGIPRFFIERGSFHYADMENAREALVAVYSGSPSRPEKIGIFGPIGEKGEPVPVILTRDGEAAREQEENAAYRAAKSISRSADGKALVRKGLETMWPDDKVKTVFFGQPISLNSKETQDYLLNVAEGMESFWTGVEKRAQANRSGTLRFTLDKKQLEETRGLVHDALRSADSHANYGREWIDYRLEEFDKHVEPAGAKFRLVFDARRLLHDVDALTDVGHLLLNGLRPDSLDLSIEAYGGRSLHDVYEKEGLSFTTLSAGASAYLAKQGLTPMYHPSIYLLGWISDSAEPEKVHLPTKDDISEYMFGRMFAPTLEKAVRRSARERGIPSQRTEEHVRARRERLYETLRTLYPVSGQVYELLTKPSGPASPAKNF